LGNAGSAKTFLRRSFSQELGSLGGWGGVLGNFGGKAAFILTSLSSYRILIKEMQRLKAFIRLRHELAM